MENKTLKLMSLFLTGALLFLFSAAAGYAFVVRTGKDITIHSDEVIDEDLYLAGDGITIDGTVNGDLYAAGKSIMIRGYVEDNAVLAADSVTVLGDVGRGLVAAGRKLHIGGRVSGDIILLGSDVEIDETAKIDGDFLFGARETLVKGPVEGYVLGGGQKISINTSIRDSVTVGMKDLVLEQSARIGGDLTYYSENDAIIFSGAQVAGTITHNLPEYREKLKKIFPFILIAGIVGKFFGFLMVLLSGLTFILIAPKWLNSLTESIKGKPGTCAGWGAVILFGVPVGIFIALITVVGIPLGVITLFLYLTTVYLSQIITGLFIGKLILGKFNGADNKALMFGSLALGLFIIRLVRLIPVVGYFVGLAAALFGLGSFIVAETARRAGLQAGSELQK